MTDFLHSLKFQIVLVLLLLIGAMIGTIVVSQYTLATQLQNEKIIQLGGKLQHASQQLSMQAMNYIANAPQDASAYERDLNLYYQDLMSHIETFDMIEDAFMSQQFAQNVTGMDDMMETRLSEEAELAVKALHDLWRHWREKLMARLGPSVSMPQLEQAAGYINLHGKELSQAADQLIDKLTQHAQQSQQQVARLNQFFLLAALVTTIGIFIWFYYRVIKPLGETSQGMRNAALGNFTMQLPVRSRDEIGLMSQQFNHLNKHLDVVFQLMTRLQEGSNLDEVLQFISEEFSQLLPLDWIGILFVTGDNKIQLERGYADRQAESFGSIRFDLHGTLLEQSMLEQRPLHIPDIAERLKQNTKVYRFLDILISKGCKESIFLPLDEQGALRGVLVFASRQSHAYTEEHLSLLKNISLLITLSFNRTVKLAEYQHLAAIGRFATGIAHEIRSPLATITMALDYFRHSELTDNARKRAELASAEAERMQGLMEDILLYSKPLVLHTSQVNVAQLLQDVREIKHNNLQARSLRMEIIAPESMPEAEVDPDRLKQVFINLTDNAIQASEDAGLILWTISYDPLSHWLTMDIHNQGETIPEELLTRIFEPFFTTRAHGTGLGLNIVKRIIESHGGRIEAQSSQAEGTRVIMQLPPAQV
ncbi:MAG: ATP-binding protein [Chromatiales bacterium]